MQPVTGMLKEFYTNDFYELMAVEDALLTATDTPNCETCGKHLRFIYHVYNKDTGETEGHGSECFKKLFDTEKVVKTWNTTMTNEMAIKVLKTNEKVMSKMNAKKIQK